MVKLAEIKIMPFAKELWLIIAVALVIQIWSQNSATLLKTINKPKTPSSSKIAWDYAEHKKTKKSFDCW